MLSEARERREYCGERERQTYMPRTLHATLVYSTSMWNLKQLNLEKWSNHGLGELGLDV